MEGVFTELGLTKNESKVYEALLHFGKLGAGDLSGKSGVPYGRIYNVLESLIGKGFVDVVPEKTKKYVPAKPESFLKIIENKEKSLADLKEKVKEMEKFYERTDKNPLIVGEGRKAFHDIVRQSKEAEKYVYSIKWSSEYQEEWVEGMKKRMKKGVEYKTLARYDEETKKNVLKWLKHHKNTKIMDNQGLAMSVIDDEEVMLGLIKSNVTLLIRNKEFAKIMKKLFESYYKNAEEIK